MVPCTYKQVQSIQMVRLLYADTCCGARRKFKGAVLAVKAARRLQVLAPRTVHVCYTGCVWRSPQSMWKAYCGSSYVPCKICRTYTGRILTGRPAERQPAGLHGPRRWSCRGTSDPGEPAVSSLDTHPTLPETPAESMTCLTGRGVWIGAGVAGAGHVTHTLLDM